MKQNEARQMAKNLVNKFGLSINASVNTGPDGPLVVLEPDDIHPNEGFQILINIGWRNLQIEFLPGKFAADLLHQMANCPFENKQMFSNVAGQILNEKGILTFKVNDAFMDPLAPESWPSDWKLLSFKLKKSPLEINTDNYQLTEQLINKWVERFFGCIIALSPLEEIEDNYEIKGLPEGAVKSSFVNRYERSRYNRSMCLNFHGNNCQVCGINFKDIYGEIGDGFIHVHHTIPVSQLNPGYIINPIKDLVPVCPNCHSMLHRRNPPYSVMELQQIIGKTPL
jgi:5-methylcytosine-specific restriction protein A